MRIGFCVLINLPVNFEDILTFTSTRINDDIKFQKNLQLDDRLSNILGLYSIQLDQMRGFSLLSQTFQTTLAI